MPRTKIIASKGAQTIELVVQYVFQLNADGLEALIVGQRCADGGVHNMKKFQKHLLQLASQPDSLRGVMWNSSPEPAKHMQDLSTLVCACSQPISHVSCMQPSLDTYHSTSLESASAWVMPLYYQNSTICSGNGCSMTFFTRLVSAVAAESG